MPQLQSIEHESPLALSEIDVQRLLEASDTDVRVGITDKIGGAYEGRNLSDAEMMIAEQIFRMLVRDTELRVRVTLAEHVKTSDQIPRDIILKMAKDVEAVALPVLRHSEVLTDKDLIELIENSEEISRQLAVAQRAKVSSTVSDTLIKKGDERVAQSLADNQGAQLSETGLNTLIEKHKSNPMLMQSVSKRPYLPLPAVEKLVHVVSGSLAESLRSKYNIAAGEIDKEVEKTRESETFALIRQAQSQEDVDQLVVQLMAFERLTPSMILGALCQGNFHFFETSLAKLANIPVINARALISDKGDLGFNALYNKSGLPETMFPAVKLLLKVIREIDKEGQKPGNAHYSNQVVDRLLQQAKTTPVDNLSYIIALVRRIS